MLLSFQQNWFHANRSSGAFSIKRKRKRFLGLLVLWSAPDPAAPAATPGGPAPRPADRPLHRTARFIPALTPVPTGVGTEVVRCWPGPSPGFDRTARCLARCTGPPAGPPGASPGAPDLPPGHVSNLPPTASFSLWLGRRHDRRAGSPTGLARRHTRSAGSPTDLAGAWPGTPALRPA